MRVPHLNVRSIRSDRTPKAAAVPSESPFTDDVDEEEDEREDEVTIQMKTTSPTLMFDELDPTHAAHRRCVLQVSVDIFELR